MRICHLAFLTISERMDLMRILVNEYLLVFRWVLLGAISFVRVRKPCRTKWVGLMGEQSPWTKPLSALARTLSSLQQLVPGASNPNGRQVIVWVLVLSSFLVVHSLASEMADVLSHSPFYDTVERLESYGCAQATVRSIRPFSYQALRESLPQSPEEAFNCRAPVWLMQEGNIIGLGFQPNEARGAVLLQYQDQIQLPGIEAQLTPLFPDREGRPHFSGANLYFEYDSRTQFGRQWGLAVEGTVGLLGALDDYRFPMARFYLHEGFIKAFYRRVEVGWGRLQMRFGSAHHGNLLLSAAGAPLDLFRFAISPHRVPIVGPLALQFWLARQGDSTVFVKNAKLLGLEIGLRPFDALELALAEVFQFGGNGLVDLEFSDVPSLLLYSGDPSLDSKRQRAFAMEVGLWLPNKLSKIYAQFLFEKLTVISDWFEKDLSYLIGGWLPNIGGGDLRLEYVRTVPAAYTHSIWRQGLTYRGSPLGHPIGPGSSGVYVDVGFPPLKKWRPKIGFAYESRLKNPTASLSNERRYIFGGDFIRRWENTELLLSTKYAKAEDHGFILGESRDLVAVFSQLRYSFF